ncbi:hypothetical protein ATJ97_3724 [Georgenia soli]|uniref:Uncharacterized protein n=1 Tax=Georgenia soli TaxID=638953 RepID=A0A2A9ERG3_9MICO|nr:hypothetical protein [Georgenia soli]PFG41176.1 hypothetical protein ATJ97_3724 [Georgenia soli]
MREPSTPRRPGWFAQLSPARKGWLLLGGGLLATAFLASAGVNSSVLAALLAVTMGIGLVLGLAPILSAGTPSTSAGALTPTRPVPARVGARAGARAFAKVPPSWEYYETFGR